MSPLSPAILGHLTLLAVMLLPAAAMGLAEVDLRRSAEAKRFRHETAIVERERTLGSLWGGAKDGFVGRSKDRINMTNSKVLQ